MERITYLKYITQILLLIFLVLVAIYLYILNMANKQRHYTMLFLSHREK